MDFSFDVGLSSAAWSEARSPMCPLAMGYPTRKLGNTCEYILHLSPINDRYFPFNDFIMGHYELFPIFFVASVLALQLLGAPLTRSS